jgi:hypothetical protein
MNITEAIFTFRDANIKCATQYRAIKLRLGGLACKKMARKGAKAQGKQVVCAGLSEIETKMFGSVCGTELGNSLVLDLSYPFPCQVEPFPDIFQT